MARYEKRKILGVRVLVMREEPTLGIYAVRLSKLPVGLEFRNTGNGWAVIAVERLQGGK